MDLTCPSCGKAIPENAGACPGCGTAHGSSFPAGGAAGAVGSPAPKKGMETWMIVLIVCGGLGALCFFTAIVAAIAIPNLLAAKLSSNETAAIATLRNLASCQAQIQTGGRIDCDGDGIGEHGTFLELTGSTGTRAGFLPEADTETASGGFEETGDRLNPPILSSVLSRVDALGVAMKSGYCFAIYLPDSSKAGGWTRETNSAAPTGHEPGLSGGTGRVGVDRAETRWCAYAWPMNFGNSGNRAFYIDQRGDVYDCANGTALHQGAGNPPAADAAFPPGKDGPMPGVAGSDGEVWNLRN